MQGNPQVIEALNRALTIELTAINQYFCQAKMCENWGFLKLYEEHEHESIGEMKHAEKLIERILFLEGVPEIARYDVIRVGSNVKEQFENDLQLELNGVKLYNAAATTHKQLWLVPGGGHTSSYKQQPKAYQQRVLAFFSQYLSS